MWRCEEADHVHRRVEAAFDELAAQEEVEAFEQLLERVYGESLD